MKYIKTFENFKDNDDDSFSKILFTVLKRCRINQNFVSFEKTPISNLFKTLEEDSENINKIVKRVYDICVGNTKVTIPEYKGVIEQKLWLDVLIYDIMNLLHKHNHRELFIELMGDEKSKNIFRENLKHIFANIFFLYDRVNGQYFTKGKIITGLN